MSTPGTPGDAPDPFDAAVLAQAEPMVAVMDRIAGDLESIRTAVYLCAVLLSGVLVALIIRIAQG